MKVTYKLSAAIALCVAMGPIASFAQDKPNILWLFQEDTSPWIGCCVATPR